MTKRHSRNRRQRSLVGKLKRIFIRRSVLMVAVSVLRLIYLIAKLLNLF